MKTAWLIVCSTLLAACLDARGEPAQAPRGTIDLRFDLHTRPGGPPGPAAAGITTINIHLTVDATEVLVSEDGKFSFRVEGVYRMDSFGSAGGVTLQNDEQRQATLSGAGVINRDGTLTLQLAWSHGAGLLFYTVRGVTYVARQPAVMTPHEMDWNLKPTAESTEELSADVQRKTTTYKSNRPSAAVGSQAAAMTEQIELRFVRHDRLVPRG